MRSSAAVVERKEENKFNKTSIGKYMYANRVLMFEDEKALFDAVLSTGVNFFEFGSGGSTLFAFEHANLKSITTVDSDTKWLEKVKAEKPLESDVKSGRIRFKHVDIGQTGKAGFPDHPGAGAGANYSAAIIGAKPVPDLVLVDGRYRVACFLQTILAAIQEDWPQLTIMIHDYHRWPYQENAEAVLGKPTRSAGFDQNIHDRCRRDHDACLGGRYGGWLVAWVLSGEKIRSMKKNNTLLKEMETRLKKSEDSADRV